MSEFVGLPDPPFNTSLGSSGPCRRLQMLTAAVVRACMYFSAVVKRSFCAPQALHRTFARVSLCLQLSQGDVLSVGELLLYANDSGVDCYPLVEWWQAKAPQILDACA